MLCVCVCVMGVGGWWGWGGGGGGGVGWGGGGDVYLYFPVTGVSIRYFLQKGPIKVKADFFNFYSQGP